MNRQIKFRGKEIRTGEWLYGDLVHSQDGKRCAILAIGKDSYDECEVDPETVGQFTGMHDSGWHEIYEGDIVTWVFFKGIWEVGKVEYKSEEAQFRIVNRLNTADNRENTTTIQNKRLLRVVGNIHDNPEKMAVE